jgi:ABC-2 type transport system permease protein
MVSKSSGRVLAMMERVSAVFWPWSGTAKLITGRFDLVAVGSLAVAIALAAWFARSQFERSLRFDSAAARSTAAAERASRFEWFYRVPEQFLRDPLGVLVSKELRFLSRAPRFRLLFLMGCSFGLLIWLPLLLRPGAPVGIRSNYLTIVTAYALMLLGEALFWNQFGMDRSAAQTYFVAPVRMATVLLAKNIAAVFFIALELSFVIAACLLLRFPVSGREAGEAAGVTAVLTVLLLAVGNLMSVRYTRPVDPAKSWRNSSGRSQAWLLILYPVLSAPVLLAYGARYAFDTDLAFWAVIAADLLMAGAFYWVALESAAETALERREEIVQLLSNAQTPVAG